ncbi:conserved hypothetical protein [Coccidioides posadasii str. Silveira]|uniref:Uncharacterized protein n=2 Tax=Coccidioides posadasii TaxID=199306 RepID=E9D739_COCPS|nr:conserved hypothetical protein [Coccidioides posadasii str. Silveira]KMM68764.1 hypothetical protein CPAG_05088 [Coccidioides posadasii RMSCC 3488]
MPSQGSSRTPTCYLKPVPQAQISSGTSQSILSGARGRTRGQLDVDHSPQANPATSTDQRHECVQVTHWRRPEARLERRQGQSRPYLFQRRPSWPGKRARWLRQSPPQKTCLEARLDKIIPATCFAGAVPPA